jgi:hypothetical protein
MEGIWISSTKISGVKVVDHEARFPGFVFLPSHLKSVRVWVDCFTDSVIYL